MKKRMGGWANLFGLSTLAKLRKMGNAARLRLNPPSPKPQVEDERGFSELMLVDIHLYR